MNEEELNAWKIERYNAIKGTLEEFTACITKTGYAPSSPEAIEIMYHKWRTAITDLDDDIREASHKWLIDHGYASLK
jgi:hypothetical protein